VLTVLANPWWIIVVTSFSTGNRPDCVPLVFQSVLADLQQVQEQLHVPSDKAHAERLALARKFRDILLKSGMVSGYSKVNKLPFRLCN
jgi:hypothetical protein